MGPCWRCIRATRQKKPRPSFANFPNRLPQRIFGFYILRKFNRPDLKPDLMRPSEVPQDLTAHECSLWADAALSRRGVSVLRTLPQFSHCTEVPLGKPGARMGSELLDCSP